MRLWSLHPKYLDSKGLVACWRESLLAQKVLLEETRGYKNHPQLDRFKKTENPIAVIGCYLWHIWEEANNRNYKFNLNKIKEPYIHCNDLTVTNGQLEYEWRHLENKLDDRRSQKQFDKNCKYTQYGKNIEPHLLFKVIEGDIEQWEKQKN